VATRENQVEDAGAELSSFVSNVIAKDSKAAALFTSPAVTRKVSRADPERRLERQRFLRSLRTSFAC